MFSRWNIRRTISSKESHSTGLPVNDERRRPRTMYLIRRSAAAVAPASFALTSSGASFEFLGEHPVKDPLNRCDRKMNAWNRNFANFLRKRIAAPELIDELIDLRIAPQDFGFPDVVFMPWFVIFVDHRLMGRGQKSVFAGS